MTDISNTHLMIDILSVQVNISLEWMPKDHIDSKSTLFMLWLGPIKQQTIRWTNLPTPYNVTGPQ